MSFQPKIPNTYVVISSTDGEDHQLLLVTHDPATIGPFLTSSSSGNQKFSDGGVLDAGATTHTPFGAVTIHITALRTDGRTKTLYVVSTGRVHTTNPKEFHCPLVLKRCSMCAKWCEPADDEGHCSYECATGG